MKTPFLIPLAAAFIGLMPASAQSFRPPSVPLVTFDPYLSIWSAADHLTDRPTQHWTARTQSLVSLIRVDGTAYRLMGNEPDATPALPQTGLQVTPTRSIYEFQSDKIHVTLTFMRPALPDDLDAMALPLSYLTWAVRSVDGKDHAVSLYDSTSSQLVVNNNDEPVQWQREKAGNLTALRVGTVEQDVLGSSGDDHRINWGYAYAAAASAQARAAIGADNVLLNAFVAKGDFAGRGRRANAARCERRTARIGIRFRPRQGFRRSGRATGHGRLRRDITPSSTLAGSCCPTGGATAPPSHKCCEKAASDYPQLARRCEEFDREIDGGRHQGGRRQVRADVRAGLPAMRWPPAGWRRTPTNSRSSSPRKTPATATLPRWMSFFRWTRIWILLSPTLAKAYTGADSQLRRLVGIGSFPMRRMIWAPIPSRPAPTTAARACRWRKAATCSSCAMRSPRWTATRDFVAPWWPQLTQWAEYLEKYGLDPENQLCTDDFMGHLAHNANLSIKAILGLACLRRFVPFARRHGRCGQISSNGQSGCRALGNCRGRRRPFRLAFDKPGTWSQKYNLVWDRILGLNVFPPDVAQKEVAHYKTVMQRYGVPLDSRTKLTKTDWTFWSATLAENQADFETLISPILDYLNQTTARSPFVDSYVTDDVRSDGMHARPVIGGVFIKMLADRATWTKWAGADKTKVGDWAALPEPPKIAEVVPTAQKTAALWRYTTLQPSDDWTHPKFDASSWKEGPASFGTDGTPGAVVRTRWDTGDIWLRREITLPDQKYDRLQFSVHHDEDVEIYVNDILAAKAPGFTTSYVTLDIRPAARALLQPKATVTLAVHCHQTTGGQNIDIGLVNVEEVEP